MIDYHNDLPEERIISTKSTQEETDYEYSLRPKTIDEYVGQNRLNKILKYSSRRQRNAERHWIMFFYTDRPDLAKQLLRG